MVDFSLMEVRYLEGQMVGRLATASRKGIPHVTPICYASNSEKVFINTGRDSKKMRNISDNKTVAFVIDEYIGWRKIEALLSRAMQRFLIDRLLVERL